MQHQCTYTAHIKLKDLPHSLLSSENGETVGFLAIKTHSPTTYMLPTTPVREAHTKRLRCAGVPAVMAAQMEQDM